MVRCQEFKQWLNHQGAVDENTYQQLMAHTRACRPCNALRRSDMALDDLLKNGMHRVNPPKGLLTRARNRCREESRPKSWRIFDFTWKHAIPASAVAAMVIIVLINPFAPRLGSVDEVAAHSIANHLSASTTSVYLSNDVVQVSRQLTRRLGHEVRLPDLNRLGLKLIGGRKCHLGKVNAAFIFCDSKGGRASLFVIRQNDVSGRFHPKRKYIIQEGDHTVTVWQESEMVYALVT